MQGITDGFWESHVNEAALELFRRLLGRPVRLMIEVRFARQTAWVAYPNKLASAHHLSDHSGPSQAAGLAVQPAGTGCKQLDVGTGAVVAWCIRRGQQASGLTRHNAQSSRDEAAKKAHWAQLPGANHWPVASVWRRQKALLAESKRQCSLTSSASPEDPMSIT